MQTDLSDYLHPWKCPGDHHDVSIVLVLWISRIFSQQCAWEPRGHTVEAMAVKMAAMRRNDTGLYGRSAACSTTAGCRFDSYPTCPSEPWIHPGL